MKKILLLAASFALIGAGCLAIVQPPISSSPGVSGGSRTIIPLGESFTLKVGQSGDILGGLRVTLISIGDSRCKQGVQCIWAGELSPKLRIEMPNQGAASEELTLGTLTKREADALGYHFALTEAKEDQATLVVTK